MRALARTLGSRAARAASCAGVHEAMPWSVVVVGIQPGVDEDGNNVTIAAARGMRESVQHIVSQINALNQACRSADAQRTNRLRPENKPPLACPIVRATVRSHLWVGGISARLHCGACIPRHSGARLRLGAAAMPIESIPRGWREGPPSQPV